MLKMLKTKNESRCYVKTIKVDAKNVKVDVVKVQTKLFATANKVVGNCKQSCWQLQTKMFANKKVQI